MAWQEQLFPTLLSIRERRASLYTMLEHGLLSLISSNDEQTYQSLLANLTTQFSSCSLSVRDIQAAATQHDALGLAQLCDELQSLEKDKLTVTLQAHQARYMISLLQHGQDSAGGDGTHVHDCEHHNRKAKAARVMGDIQAAAKKLEVETCGETIVQIPDIEGSMEVGGSEDGFGSGPVVGEDDGMLKADFEEWLRGFTRKLEAVVKRINEIWEELAEEFEA